MSKKFTLTVLAFLVVMLGICPMPQRAHSAGEPYDGAWIEADNLGATLSNRLALLETYVTALNVSTSNAATVALSNRLVVVEGLTNSTIAHTALFAKGFDGQNTNASTLGTNLQWFSDGVLTNRVQTGM